MKEKILHTLITYPFVVMLTSLYGLFFKEYEFEDVWDNIGFVTFIYFISLLIVIVIEGIRRNK